MSASQAIRERQSGSRRDPKHRGKSVGTSFGITDLGLNRLNVQQVYALHRMFLTHPAVQAARTVLHAQLFSGGVHLMRDGESLKTVKDTAEDKKPRIDQSSAPGSTGSSPAGSSAGSSKGEGKGIREAFARHLDEYWLPFAKEVCDSFLMWGMCVVVFDLEEEDPSKKAARLAKEEEGIGGGKRAREPPALAKRLVPRVPDLGTYEVGFEGVGRYQYTRKYAVYAQAPGQPVQVDEQAVVHIRQAPDSSGNVNSPIATVWELGSFVHAITELAMTAEIARAQPQIVTQMRKQEKGTGLDPGTLFFDAESRNVQAGQDHEESEGAARSLEMQAHLMKIINQMQTTHRDAGPSGSSSTPAFQPPDIPPKLFTLPKEQEMAPNTNKPEPRGDLEALMRLSIDQVSAALGVPSSLVFEGKFAGKSTQQLQLLNSTVSQLAKSINDVLTKTYLALYPDERTGFSGAREEAADTNVELKLRTAPLAASEELVALFGAQLIDSDVAVPAAMHALGSSNEEIEAALERIKAKEEKECECQEDEREYQKKDRDVAFKEREVNLRKTEADILKTQHDAKAPFNTGASSGGGAGGGGGGGGSSASK